VAIIILNRRRIVSRLPDWFRDTEAPLVLVTARDAAGPEELASVRSQFDAIVAVDDYDSQALEEAVLTIARQRPVTRIASAAEVDVLRAARLREQLGLVGQGLSSALAYRDKLRMKALLAERGVTVARMRALDRAQDLRDFADAVGFPLVLKPRLGGGSVGVRIVHGVLELDQALTELERCGLAAAALMAEAWVEGEFFTVDGLMARGETLQVWPSATTANFEAVSGRSSLSSHMLRPADPLTDRVRDFVRRVVAALPPVEEVSAFHAEVFVRPDGSLCLCEIACRPGGCGHVPVYEMAFGINLYAASLRGQAGLDTAADFPDAPPVCCGGFVWFPPRAGRLVRLPRDCPVDRVVRYEPVAQVGRDHQAPKSVADHVAEAFLQAPPDVDLSPALAAVNAWWHEAVRWD
jgi:biotin carboxylase